MSCDLRKSFIFASLFLAVRTNRNQVMDLILEDPQCSFLCTISCIILTFETRPLAAALQTIGKATSMKLLAPLFVLLPLTLAANNTFANNDVYKSWLASADYQNFLFLPADNQENGVAVHWTVSDDNTTLSLAVAVEASGWLGFGVSSFKC